MFHSFNRNSCLQAYVRNVYVVFLIVFFSANNKNHIVFSSARIVKHLLFGRSLSVWRVEKRIF